MEIRRKRRDSTCSEMLHSFHLSHCSQPQDGIFFDLSNSVASCSNSEPSYFNLLEMLCYCFPTPLNSSTFPTSHLTPCPQCVFMLNYTLHILWLCQEANGNIFYQSGMAQNHRRPKVKAYIHLILVSVITFSVTNISKPYLWLAGHVSVLSKPGYRLCGFLMIYLHKICGMLKMELSTLLYGTSVHVRK